MNHQTLTLIAPCLFGLERLLGEEIDALGCNRLETIDGRVRFEADITMIPRINLSLRFAERVLIEIGRFSATTFTELFDGTQCLPWERWIGRDAQFPVKGHSIRSKLYSVPDCQSIIKKAVVSRLSSVYGISYFEETGIKYQIDFFLFQDQISLMIDTTGTPLHKRGYRPETVTAPLRETLAAAMVKLARPREGVVLCDPFCGSGTIAIEAALMMTHTAPGLNRHFAGELFPQIPMEWWEEARDVAMDEITEPDFEIWASDLDPECVRVATDAARRAGVSKYIRFRTMDALTLETEGKRGTIVTNPPYGERLMTMPEVEQLYRQMGKHFATLDSWQIYVITSHENFQGLYGRRADKVRKLYNGMIKCGFYQFFKKQ